MTWSNKVRRIRDTSWTRNPNRNCFADGFPAFSACPVAVFVGPVEPLPFISILFLTIRYRSLCLRHAVTTQTIVEIIWLHSSRLIGKAGRNGFAPLPDRTRVVMGKDV